MISDVEHLLIHLLAICISSLENIFLNLLPIIQFVVLFSSDAGLYGIFIYLDINSLSDTVASKTFCSSFLFLFLLLLSSLVI